MSSCNKCRIKDEVPFTGMCRECLDKWNADCELITKLADAGHSNHCACRMVWGLEKCQCGKESTENALKTTAR